MNNQSKFRLLSKATMMLLLIIIGLSCGSDDSVSGNAEIGVYNIEISDIGNSGNASDIRVSFQVPSQSDLIDRFQIYVIKSDDISTFSLEVAEQLASDRYESVNNNNQTVSVELPATLLDTDGEQIVEDLSYRFFVLSVPNPDLGYQSELVGSESGITLAQSNVLEIVAELNIGTGGLEVDSDGNVYLAHFGTNLSGVPPGDVLYKVTPEGVASVFAQGLQGGTGNVIGPNGNIFQSNIIGGTVSEIALDGTLSTYASGFQGPVGVVFDEGGNLYVTSCYDNTLKKITADGSVSILATSIHFGCPTGLTIDEDQNLYVSSFQNGTIVKVTISGTTSVLATIPGNNNGHLTYHEGSLYVAARANNQIYKVSMSGSMEVYVGGGERGHKEGSVLSCQLSLPNDLAFSPDGKYLYINDYKPVDGTPFQTAVTPTYLKRVRLEIN